MLSVTILKQFLFSAELCGFERFCVRLNTEARIIVGSVNKITVTERINAPFLV